MGEGAGAAPRRAVYSRPAVPVSNAPATIASRSAAALIAMLRQLVSLPGVASAANVAPPSVEITTRPDVPLPLEMLAAMVWPSADTARPV